MSSTGEEIVRPRSPVGYRVPNFPQGDQLVHLGSSCRSIPKLLDNAPNGYEGTLSVLGLLSLAYKLKSRLKAILARWQRQS
jgi:hypothetical protein